MKEAWKAKRSDMAGMGLRISGRRCRGLIIRAEMRSAPVSEEGTEAIMKKFINIQENKQLKNFFTILQ